MCEELVISVGQFAPSEDKAANIASIRSHARQAADQGSRVLVMPEGSMFRTSADQNIKVLAMAEPPSGQFVTSLCEITREFGVMIAAGAHSPAEGAEGRVYNTQWIVDKGEIVGSYKKIHLYDAFSGRESDFILPANELPPIIELDGFKLAFTTCYDLRFPSLYGALADKGADVLINGAAWAKGPLKELHWLTLLRARAIENTAYIFAAGEVGLRSIGRSAIFDPMGVCLGDAGEQDDIVLTSRVSRRRLDEVRAKLPMRQHRRIPSSAASFPLPAAEMSTKQ